MEPSVWVHVWALLLTRHVTLDKSPTSAVLPLPMSKWGKSLHPPLGRYDSL